MAMYKTQLIIEKRFCNLNTSLKNIIIWGAGNRTATYMENNLFNDTNILAIVDSYVDGETFGKYTLIRPEEIINYQTYDYIVVNSQFYREIVRKLFELSIPVDKIIITDHEKEEPFRTCFERAKDVIPAVYELNRNILKQTVRINERDLYDEKSIYSNVYFEGLEYNSDYFRYRTFEFVAEELIRKKVEGELAELGVFRGLFSAVINYRFPERKLYLFDTFEGFDKEEARREYKLGRCDLNFIDLHKDTSVKQMMSNIPFPEKIKICKGFFPESLTEEAKKEKYAFVSIDVDFEESTYEGLKFFYPRLSEGGYIFVHDYNTYFLDGIKVAIDRYEHYLGKRLKTVPIADRAGTLIIVK